MQQSGEHVQSVNIDRSTVECVADRELLFDQGMQPIEKYRVELELEKETSILCH